MQVTNLYCLRFFSLLDSSLIFNERSLDTASCRRTNVAGVMATAPVCDVRYAYRMCKTSALR